MAQPREVVLHQPGERDGLSPVSLSPAFGARIEDAIAALEAIVRMSGHRFVRDDTRAVTLRR